MGDQGGHREGGSPAGIHRPGPEELMSAPPASRLGASRSRGRSPRPPQITRPGRPRRLTTASPARAQACIPPARLRGIPASGRQESPGGGRAIPRAAHRHDRDPLGQLVKPALQLTERDMHPSRRVPPRRPLAGLAHVDEHPTGQLVGLNRADLRASTSEESRVSLLALTSALYPRGYGTEIGARRPLRASSRRRASRLDGRGRPPGMTR